MVLSYLTNVAVVNKSTALKYDDRLNKFAVFIGEHYGLGKYRENHYLN
jgi:hypothetical protein